MDKNKLFGQRKWLFFVGVKALIVRGEKVLLLRSGRAELSSTMRRSFFWDMPGGKVEWGENIEETLRREVHEELGVPERALDIGDIFEASVSNIVISHGIRVPLILITYRCKLKDNHSEKFELSDEHSAYRWVDKSEAQKLLKTKLNKTFIRDLKSLKLGSQKRRKKR